MRLPYGEWDECISVLGCYVSFSPQESFIEARGVCLSVGHGAPLGPSSTNCFAGRCLPCLDGGLEHFLSFHILGTITPID